MGEPESLERLVSGERGEHENDPSSTSESPAMTPESKNKHQLSKEKYQLLQSLLLKENLVQVLSDQQKRQQLLSLDKHQERKLTEILEPKALPVDSTAIQRQNM